MTASSNPGLYCLDGEREKERGQERKLNNYSTKIYEGVPIIVKGQYKCQLLIKDVGNHPGMDISAYWWRPVSSIQ